jgi:Rrf2 family protein
MRKSTRFPAAVHIMTMLAAQPDQYMSSEIIASSMDTNRVVVRRLLALLAEFGLVSSQAGISGGAKLEKKPKEITLLEIYQAVERESLFRLHSPHPKCPVGACVTKDLTKVLDDAESAMERELATKTLADVSRRGVREMKAHLAAQSG